MKCLLAYSHCLTASLGHTRQVALCTQLHVSWWAESLIWVWASVKVSELASCVAANAAPLSSYHRHCVAFWPLLPMASHVVGGSVDQSVSDLSWGEAGTLQV